MWRTGRSSLYLSICDKKTYTRTDDWSIVPAKEPQLLLETGPFSEKSHAGPTLQKIVWSMNIAGQNLEFSHVIRNQTANLSRSSHATGQHAGRRHSWAVATDIWPGLNGLGGLCLQWNTPCCNHQHRIQQFLQFTGTKNAGVCLWKNLKRYLQYVLRCFLRCSTTVAILFKNQSTDFFDQVLDVSNFLVSMVQFCCPATVWNSCMSFSLRETSVATSLGTDYGYSTGSPAKRGCGSWEIQSHTGRRRIFLHRMKKEAADSRWYQMEIAGYIKYIIYIYTTILRMHDHFILQSFKFDFHGPIQIHRPPLGTRAMQSCIMR